MDFLRHHKYLLTQTRTLQHNVADHGITDQRQESNGDFHGDVDHRLAVHIYRWL